MSASNTQSPYKIQYTGPLSPEFALLGLLAIKPTHGYNLYQRLITDLGQVWHISLSQTYNILNRLEAQGFIIGLQQDQAKRPARRQFQLTPAGLQRFQEWLSMPSYNSVRAIRVEFTSRLYFASLLNPPAGHQLIDAQIVETRAGIKRLEAVLDDLPTTQIFNRLGLELRLSQLNSILAWLDGCHRAVDNMNANPHL